MGATLVSITDSVSSPFFNISHYTILAAPVKDSMGFSSPICMYCLFDAIISKIHDERKDMIVERLNNMKIPIGILICIMSKTKDAIKLIAGYVLIVLAILMKFIA